MATFEYTHTFDYPAAAVFARLADLEARPTWIAGILEVRVTPPGPAHLGTSYYESGKFSGFKSEKTLLVTELEQDRLLTLATPADAKDPWRERYAIEPLSSSSCRVHFTIDAGNVPKVAEFFMRNTMKKAQPENAERLKTILTNQAYRAS